ncbi:MAG: PIN domain-containing protein [Thermoanaerobaculia bacterium]|nr:PIN domain-containing protein [Thermoanaerobaculia bacterium]
MIALDTSLLSAVFRRRRPSTGSEPGEAAFFRHLVESDEPMFVPGIVLQELLSGTRSAAQRRRLEEILEGFEVRTASVEDHRLAATIRDDCRRSGIATAAIDCLITAQAIRADAHLFTLDRDFDRIAAISNLRLLREP